MITALDSSVILDVLSGKNPFLETSIGIMQKTRSEGKLIVCECVLAEVFPALITLFRCYWQCYLPPLDKLIEAG